MAAGPLCSRVAALCDEVGPRVGPLAQTQVLGVRRRLDEPLRDHAGLVEGQAGPGAVLADDVDPVGRAVAELGDDAGALADLGRGDAPADQGVDEGGLAGFQPAGDGHPQRLTEPAPHVEDLRLGATTEPVADLLAEVGHPRAQWSRCHGL